jgi:hypothetical protein
MELAVSALLSPKIERSGSDFVDHWVCVAALGKIYALDVGLAGITALHSNMGKLARGVYRKPLVIFFATIWAGDAAEVPFGKTERAQQRPERSVPLWTQNAGAGLSLTEGTNPVTCASSRRRLV